MEKFAKHAPAVLAALLMILLVYVLALSSCKEHFKRTDRAISYSYVVFEVDSNKKDVGAAYIMRVAYDTNHLVGDKLQWYRDTTCYILWPFAVTDSFRRVLKTKDGRDSIRKQWGTLNKWAILYDLGLPKTQP